MRPLLAPNLGGFSMKHCRFAREPVTSWGMHPLMSAFPLTAVEKRTSIHVGDVPISDIIEHLFDHRVSPCQ
jgi:hypothetical protein